MRPSDWFLVELPSDPTPGDAFGIRSLAAKYAAIATIAGEAADGVTRARSSGAASAWVGDAGDIFRDRSHRMPGELAKANDSYSVVAAALKVWADAVDDTQAQADRGLQQAREAHADRVSATAALDQAQASWSTVNAQQLSYQRLQKDVASAPPPTNVTMPTPDQLRSVARAVTQSHASVAAAEHRIADADVRLAAARALVLDAQARRDDSERRVVHQIGEAEDRAVKPSSVWEAIQDSAAWQALVVVATVVITIVSIVAIFVGGPLVWALILATTILLVVNALLSIAQGKDAWGELAMLAIGLIPGGRVLGLAAKGVEAMSRMGVAGEHLAAGVGAVTGAVRSGTQVSTRVVKFAGARIGLGVATRVPNGVLSALHAESGSNNVLAKVFNSNYKELKGVNAVNYGTKPGYQNNCTRCVIAADQTLGGTPMVAESILGKSAGIDSISDYFGMPYSDFAQVPNYDSIVQTMTNLGVGSRGIVYIGRPAGQVGHVINVIFDHNGVVFLDAQVAKFAKLEHFRLLQLLVTKVGV